MMRPGLGALLLAVFLRPAGAIEPLPVAEVAPGLYVHEAPHEEMEARNDGAIGNIGFIVGADAVLVVDTGGSLAAGQRLRAAIRAVTDLPIRYVVLSHVHPDHVFGTAAFAADAPEIIGHAKLPGALAQRGAYYARMLERALGDAAAGSEIVVPTRLVEASAELDLGARRVTVRAHGPAHTDNDLSLFDHASGTLWLSDLLFVERIPVIDGSILGWLAELSALAALPAVRAVPGHGPPSVAWPEASAAQERYLRLVLDETRAAIAARIGIARAPAEVARAERGNWLLFDAYHARNVTAAFKELEWE